MSVGTKTTGHRLYRLCVRAVFPRSRQNRPHVMFIARELRASFGQFCICLPFASFRLPMGVEPTLNSILASKVEDKVHVTLTFAQSLDGRIAGKHGLQLRLSGEESMLLTHWMRTRHDAILVGIGTALNDNPQLNGKYFLASLLRCAETH
jgi:hypothetical protein